MNKTEDIDRYLSTIPYLKYIPVDDIVWNIIQQEGLDEELNSHNKSNWYFAKLEIIKDDKIGLKNHNQEIIEKFNEFDIKLKNLFDLRFIDLIDYDNGEIKIITHLD